MGKPTSHRVPRRAALVAGAGSKAVPKCMSEPDSMPETVAGKHRRETMAGLRMLKAPKATRLNLKNHANCFPFLSISIPFLKTIVSGMEPKANNHNCRDSRAQRLKLTEGWIQGYQTTTNRTMEIFIDVSENYRRNGLGPLSSSKLRSLQCWLLWCSRCLAYHGPQRSMLSSSLGRWKLHWQKFRT